MVRDIFLKIVLEYFLTYPNIIKTTLFNFALFEPFKSFFTTTPSHYYDLPCLLHIEKKKKNSDPPLLSTTPFIKYLRVSLWQMLPKVRIDCNEMSWRTLSDECLIQMQNFVSCFTPNFLFCLFIHKWLFNFNSTMQYSKEKETGQMCVWGGGGCKLNCNPFVIFVHLT